MREELKYDELELLFRMYCPLDGINTDFNSRLAFLSLVCYLKHKLSLKKPDITYYQIIKQLAGLDFPENVIKGFAIICDLIGRGCTEFPNFGIEDKQIPNKIKEILGNWLPF